jgi:hypothetical protein
MTDAGAACATARHARCRERAYLGLRTDRHGPPLVLRQLSSSAISPSALPARAPPSIQVSPRSIHVSPYTGWQPLRRPTLDPNPSEESSAPWRGQPRHKPERML